jgi:diguanylate cyclase (GGDEF)-like protein/PAS domain S-box-containing protein
MSRRLRRGRNCTVEKVRDRIKESANSTTLRVLIVEDAEDDALQVLRLLKRGGYAVGHDRVDSLEGMRAALDRQVWDIVICDFSMPGFDGRAALALLRERNADLPFIVVSGTIGEDAAVAMMKAGASDYVMKDNLARLVPAVQRELRDAKARREHRRAEEALEESQLRFRQLAENIREVFWLSDPSKNEILYVSPAYEDIWGRRAEALYSSPRDWIEAIHPEDRGRVLEAAQTKQARGDYDEEYRITRPDGSIRWIRDQGFPVLGEDRKIIRLAGVAEDITERKRAEGELRESERRFSDLLGNVDLVSVMMDPEGRITYCNDYLLQLTGWQLEQVLGRDWFERFLPPPHEKLKSAFSALLADTPAAWHHENEILTRSGVRRLIRWNNSVLRSASGEVIGTASIGEDITERKEAEEKIKRLNRVYAVLSGINAAIVRIRDRRELFQEACRIIVEHGRFILGWIAVLDHSTGNLMVAGQAGLPVNTVADSAFFNGSVGLAPAGTAAAALRDKRSAVDNNIEDSLGLMDAKPAQDTFLVRRVAIELGAKSVIVLPLVVERELFGILTLYAPEQNFFDDEEIKLLNELAWDISFGLEFIAKEEKVDYLAYYDILTGLANRTLLLERVGQKLIAAGSSNRKLSVLALDVERFKSVNDALGRQAGDDLLKQIADRFRKASRDDSRLARVGADHFAIVDSDAQNEEEIGRRTESRLKKCFDPPFHIGDSDIHVSARAGIAMFPRDGGNAETLLRNAEAALKKAKASGERYVFYAEEMTARVAEQLALENKLRQALEKEEFVLHYQPKVDLETRSIVGVEALIRWQSPDLGLVPPMKFIPLMEQTGQILEVGAWALSKAVKDHLRWTQMRLPAPRIAVNVSAIQLRNKDFVGMVEKAIRRGVSPPGIDLEITESLIMEDIEGNIGKLKEVRRLGVSIAIDDFGTGYSSLAYLAKLPVQTLKIDRSFVITMLDDPDTMTLVQTIISMAHSLRLKVVAEGVDAEAQAKMLHLLRCDEMQGYVFSKPVPFDALTAMLRKAESAMSVPGVSSRPH